MNQQRDDQRLAAKAALKIVTVDRVLGLTLAAKKVTTPILNKGPEHELLDAIPHLLKIAVWAWYEMQEVEDRLAVGPFDEVAKP